MPNYSLKRTAAIGCSMLIRVAAAAAQLRRQACLEITKRPWRLSKAQRLLIVLCVGLYLRAFQPWSPAAAKGAASIYAGAATMLVLAALPPRFRLLPVVAIAIVVAFVVFVGLRAFGMQA